MAKTERIQSPSDLWTLPWDDEENEEPAISKEEQDDLTNLIASLNKKSEE